MTIMQTRRRFLCGAALAGGAGLLLPLGAQAAEPGLETTTIKLPRDQAICTMPQMIAQQLLQAEGFTDIRFVDEPASRPRVDSPDGGHPEAARAPRPSGNPAEYLARGDVDMMVGYASNFILGLDKGEALTLSSPACMSAASCCSVTKASMACAFLGFPPEPQELRAWQIGRVIFDTAVDRPWSQYFCCMLAGNREFVRRHPVAAKRAMRAILKAADLCATEPARAAQILVDGGFTPRYDYALQTLKDVPYDKWREYDAEDAIRFWALRMREAGFIKSTPQKIIAEGTDWHFLEELKRELNA